MGFKRTTKFLLITLSLVTLAACGNKNRAGDDSRDDGGVVVDIPQVVTASSCLDTRTQPAGNTWTPYEQAGAVYYDWNYNPSSMPTGRFCGCPFGYQPVCGYGIGMICVPAHTIQNRQLAWWQWNNQVNNFGFSGYNSYAGYSQGGAGSTCTPQIGQTCQVGTSSCGRYGYCLPFQNGSLVGICVQ